MIKHHFPYVGHARRTPPDGLLYGTIVTPAITNGLLSSSALRSETELSDSRKVSEEHDDNGLSLPQTICATTSREKSVFSHLGSKSLL